MSDYSSFSSRVKVEITTIDYSPLQLRALLSAFVKCNGFLRVQNGMELLDLSSELVPVAEFLAQALSSIYRVSARFSSAQTMGAKKAIRYHVLLENPAEILLDLGIEGFSSKLPLEFSNREECVSAYIAGAFLACGYVNDPKTSNYHLEFSLSDEAYAKRFSRLLNKAHSGNFSSKIATRRSQTIVYFKKSDKISELLAYLKASESCIMFENARVDREFFNIQNRLFNLENANAGKQGDASSRQIKEIEYLQEKGVVEAFDNPKISLLCEIRLANPNASMGELADLLSEEMGMEVSKSNVNHLFRAIHERYLALSEGESEES